MSIRTELLIHTKYGPREIIDFLKSKNFGDVKTEQTHTPNYCLITLTISNNEKRTINFHMGVETPIGYCNLLTMGADSTGQLILKSIADQIGGFYNPEDYEEKYQQIDGKICDQDGLSYFLRYAALTSQLKDSHDLEGFEDAIQDWNNKYRRKK